MKAVITISVIIGFILGVWTSVETSSRWGFPCSTETVHDTIVVNDTVTRTDTLRSRYAVYDLPADSVSIDTVSTLVNGKIVRSRYKITIK